MLYSQWNVNLFTKYSRFRYFSYFQNVNTKHVTLLHTHILCKSSKISYLFSPFISFFELSNTGTVMLLFLTGDARKDDALMPSQMGLAFIEFMWLQNPFNLVDSISWPFCRSFSRKQVEIVLFLSSITPFLCFPFILTPTWKLFSLLSTILSTTLFSAAILYVVSRVVSHVIRPWGRGCSLGWLDWQTLANLGLAQQFCINSLIFQILIISLFR